MTIKIPEKHYLIMRNKLKGLAFLCMAVALPLTAQNVTVSGPDGKLPTNSFVPEGKEGIVFSHL